MSSGDYSLNEFLREGLETQNLNKYVSYLTEKEENFVAFDKELINIWAQGVEASIGGDQDKAAALFTAAQSLLVLLSKSKPTDLRYSLLASNANNFLNSYSLNHVTGRPTSSLLERISSNEEGVQLIFSSLTNSIQETIGATTGSENGRIKDYFIIYEKETSLDELIGNERAKLAIRSMINLRTVNPKFRRGKSNDGKMFLLLGPPGTGKTAFGEAVATFLNKKVALLKGDAFLSNQVGVGEKTIIDIFKALPDLMTDHVVLFDEADGYWPPRNSNQPGFEARLVTTALPLLQNLKRELLHIDSFLFVIANNRLDPAIERRLLKIHVELPQNDNEYSRVLETLAIKNAVTIVNYSQIGSLCLSKKISPALIEQFIEIAAVTIQTNPTSDAQNYWDDVKPENFEQSIIFTNDQTRINRYEDFLSLKLSVTSPADDKFLFRNIGPELIASVNSYNSSTT